jgi:hypothetical protein
MKSWLIEFHRFGSLGTGLLRKGDRYLIAAADRPVREYVMDIDFVEFMDMMQSLRYPPGGSKTAAGTALQQASDLATGALNEQITAIPKEGAPLQLDLVVNAAEVASLPFEMMRYADGSPVLGQRARPVELARRVREQGLAESATKWPAKPRVLFAWAQPFSLGGAGQVPWEEHRDALRKALDPWIPLKTGADASEALTVLENASAEGIRECCETAATKGVPFTHVHILAHGYPIGKGWKQRFGIALHDAALETQVDATTPERLSEALAPLRGNPVVVTLATCDSGNVSNSVIPEKSIAHELHASGLPVVVASQLPMTKPGSTVLVKHFYGALFGGQDVRLALHEARCALFECTEAEHDWGSVVAYVRLPEGYENQLLNARLAQALDSLKAIQNHVDRLPAGTDPAVYERLINLLEERRGTLEGFMNDEDYKGRQELKDENLGLLGSAEKRMAELRFRMGADAAVIQAGLERACAWYRRAYRGNISHHWTGTQFLSLEAALNGQIADEAFWFSCLLAAQLDAEKDGEVWAFGSLAELYLLAQAAGEGERLDDAANAVEEMKRRVMASEKKDPFPLESTRQQLLRYVEWWTAGNGYFRGGRDLTGAAMRLAGLIPS